MAGHYGDHFGFRVSYERWTNGRMKTPAGSSLVLGTVVEVDPAQPGYLKQSAKDAAPLAGWCGLLVQELQFERSIYESDAAFLDTKAQGVAKANRLSVITGGAGIKVWVKNIAGETRADGRVIPSKTMYATTGSLAVGDTVSWDGSKFIKTGQGTTTVAFGKVTAVSSSILEFTLLA